MPYRMCLLVALFLSLLCTVASGSQVKCTSTSLAVLGEDITLTCEFQGHQDILQVTWQKKRGEKSQNIATYSEMYGAKIAKPFENHVTLTSPSSRSSSIKISKLERDDEACYVCLFNAYPNGAFKGEVCLSDLSPESQVKCTNSNPAVLGEDVILTCEFQAHLDVLQITWQKKQGKKTETILTYSDMYGTNIAKPFDHHVSIFNSSSRSSSIKISKLKKEDEACYVCLFNTYPNGAFTGKVVLTNLHPAKAEINAMGLRSDSNTDPAKAEIYAMGIRSDSNTDDPEIKQEHSWIRISVISGAMVTVIGILILFIYKACKKTEPATPMKLNKAETGQLTPQSIIKKLFSNCNEPTTPVRSKDDYKSVTSISNDSVAEKTSSYKEVPNSSVKKRRKEQKYRSPTSAKSLKF